MKRGRVSNKFKKMLGVAMAMVMLFGNSLSVLAVNFSDINVNDELHSGETITNNHGQLVTIYVGNSPEAVVNDGNSYTLTGNYKVTEKDAPVTSPGKLYLDPITLSSNSTPGVSPVTEEETESETGHSHNFQWKTVKQPTLNEDGLAQYICECGEVDAQQPISSATAFVKEVCNAIEKAPAGATVEVETEIYACYTAKIMEKLSERADVTFKTTFLTKDKTWKTFTIPAGMAPTDDELFYGFTYLGNLYGWGECDHVHDAACGGEEDCTHVHDEND